MLSEKSIKVQMVKSEPSVVSGNNQRESSSIDLDSCHLWMDFHVSTVKKNVEAKSELASNGGHVNCTDGVQYKKLRIILGWGKIGY